MTKFKIIDHASSQIKFCEGQKIKIDYLRKYEKWICILEEKLKSNV